MSEGKNVTDRIARFVAETRPETPYLVVDLDVVRRNYEALVQALPDTPVYYAVKANPAPPVLALLARLGACFDAASVAEIDQVLAAGVTPDRISYGNTLKKERDIQRAYQRGVRLFAFDSPVELAKIARVAPGSRVLCRLITDNAGSDWPLSRKFGCTEAEAEELLWQAHAQGLTAEGVVFHVGSQQRDPRAWDGAVAACARLFRRLEERGLRLATVNLGGGLPAPESPDVPEVGAYAQAMRQALLTHFGNHLPATMIEPGRGLVANAGVIHTEVILIADRGEAERRRWVYVDVGKFGGLMETLDEAIRYPVVSHRPGGPEPAVLAGPTCDSADVMYEHTPCPLPQDLAVGDRLEIRAAGAYTASYSAVDFNGFPPLQAYYI